MKLTKGMKKALSLLLAGALVIGGANTGVIANAAEAEDKTLAWTGSAELGVYADAECEITTDNGSSADLVVVNFSEVPDGFPAGNIISVTVTNSAIEAFEEPYVTVVATEKTGDGDDNEFSFSDASWEPICKTEDSSETVISGAIAKENASYILKASERTVTAIYVHEKDVDPLAKEDVSTPVAREKGTMESFWVDMTYVSAGWAEQYWATGAEYEGAGVEVTKDGTYEVAYKAAQDTDDIFMLFLQTNLHNKDIAKTFKIAATKLTVDSTDYEIAWVDGLMTFADSKIDEGGLRANIRNEYNQLVGADMSTPASEDTVDNYTLKGAEIPVKAGDDVVVTFEVSGMDAKGEMVDFNTVDPEGEFQYNVVETPGESAQPSPSAPANNASTGAISTSGAISTPSGIASPATATITVAKKKVVVAAGKSKNVKFTTEIAAPATSAAVVTATVKGNKKVTATVKDGKVVIKAAKKAVKGSTAKVTLTSTNASGTAVKSDVIKVSVQNKAKKIKAPKKVTLKKGKTAKVVIKVKKAENNKKKVTDTAKVTIKKVAKYMKAKTQYKKGKVIITLKGKKKGSAKMTVKIGKAKAKVNVKVK